jgi:hypothetical protein
MINHAAQNCFAQHKFAHSRSSQSAPYTVNHVAQYAMLRNMIDRVWAPLDPILPSIHPFYFLLSVHPEDGAAQSFEAQTVINLKHS